MKMQPLQDFLNLLFPKICATCDRPLSSVEKHLCLHCHQELPYITDMEEQSAKLAGRVPFSGMISLLKFKPQGMVKKLLHEIKYKNNTDLAFHLGGMLGSKFKSELEALDLDFIVPVPLHISKLKKRGYNQSSEIGKGLSAELNIPLEENFLKRTGNSETQTKKSRQERWQNVSSIFESNSEISLEGKHYLILDDVFTTGATLEACGQEIIQRGGRVSFATVASA